MSIDIFNDRVLTFNEAVKLLPPSRRTGKPLHVSALRRWHQHGILAPDGARVHLDVAKVGQTLVTSEQALKEFIRRTSPVPVTQNDTMPERYCPADIMREINDVTEQLRIAGL